MAARDGKKKGYKRSGARQKRAEAAAETVQLLKDDAELRQARERTSQHAPDPQLDALLEPLRGQHQTEYELWPGVPTLAAALRLTAESEAANATAALVFASAKNPGGGYLGGSLAQEESLAVASGLALCQEGQAMYAANRKNNRRAVYNDFGLYSPEVPVIRDETGALLGERRQRLNFITVPAPNYGVALRNGVTEDELVEALRVRIQLALQIAAEHRQRSLVLGAFGCGVFRNPAAAVARQFQEALQGPFAGVFERVVFAILDSAEAPVVRTFAAELAPLGVKVAEA